jgi:hypothetical protein
LIASNGTEYLVLPITAEPAVSRQECFSAATRRCSFAFLITTRYDHAE